MSQLEPTYLRYIYDGLVKGSIHLENTAELPEGLIGLYENVFDEREPVHIRQQLLERFAIWALLKKEVSVAFVAEVLGDSEDEIQDFIATFSSWFNSPESGKFQLYHERLKVYLLQKMSDGELIILHQKIIAKLEISINEEKEDEFSSYGLAFLAYHYSINSMIDGDGAKLKRFTCNREIWNQQLETSKNYLWTKSGLHALMKWALKYKILEVEECVFQLIELNHLSLNSAPQIIQLIAAGEIEGALKRIADFGGSDKESLRRKFILYILCLVELTSLKGSNTTYKLKAIEQLLIDVNEQLPEDHTLFDWNDFFPSLLVFQLEYEIKSLVKTKYSLFKFSKSWDFEWTSLVAKFDLEQINLLIELSSFISDDYWRIIRYAEIANCCLKNEVFSKTGNDLMNEAVHQAKQYKGDLRDNLLKTICFILIEQKKHETATNLISCFDAVCKEKIDAIIQLLFHSKVQENLNELIAQFDIENQLLKIENDYYRYLIISDLVKLKAANQQFDEAIELSNSIIDEPRVKINALTQCMIYAKKNGNQVLLESINKSIKCIIEEISDVWELDITYSELIDAYIAEGNLEDCSNIIVKIQDSYWKNQAIFKISQFHLNKSGRLDFAKSELDKLPNDCDEKYEGLLSIVKAQIESGDIENAQIEIKNSWIETKHLSDGFSKDQLHKKILTLTALTNKQSAANFLLQKVENTKGISSFEFRRSVIKSIVSWTDSNKKNLIDYLLFLHLEQFRFQELAFKEDVEYFISLKKQSVLIDFSKNISDKIICSDFLRWIIQSLEPITENQLIEKTLNLLLEETEVIPNLFWKVRSQIDNLYVLHSLKKTDLLSKQQTELLSSIEKLDSIYQVKTKMILSNLYKKIGLYKLSENISEKCYALLSSLNDEEKNQAKLSMSVELLKMGHEGKAFKLIEEVPDQQDQDVSISLNSKSEALFQFVECLLVQQKVDLANIFAKKITNHYWKDKAFSLIIVFMAEKLNDVKLANEIGIEITNKALLYSTWCKIGFNQVLSKEDIKMILKIDNSIHPEIIHNLNKGYIEGLNLKDLPLKSINELLFNNINDEYLLQVIISKLAINRAFSSEYTKEIDQIIKTLNIQWIIDLKNQ